MSKKIVVIGGVAGGMSAAVRSRRLDEKADIVVLERGPYVSFSNCCLPYHLSGEIEESCTLVLMTPHELQTQYNIDVRVKNEAIDIDREAKTVLIKNLETGEEYTEDYDYVILSPGAKAVDFPIPGLDTVPNFFLRTVPDAAGIHDTIKEKNIKDIVVMGGGFIGIEATENLRLAGLNVTLVEAAEQVLLQYDEDMIQLIHKELYDQGVNLKLNTRLEKIEDNKAYLSNGETVPCELLVKAAGVVPVSDLAEKAGLKLTEDKYIDVDQNYITSDPSIYAIGDAIKVTSRLAGDKIGLAMAGPALKQARFVADHICGIPTVNTGYIGSACIKVFDWNAAVTGLTERRLKELGKTNYDYAFVIPKDMVGIMSGSNSQFLKVIFEIPTGRILGAQAVGKGDVVKRVDVIAGMLKFQPTLFDLKDLELCYAPPFSIARDSVNFAGYVGLNLLNGVYRHVHVSDVRSLVEQKAYIIDVREPDEFDLGHIKGAVNLPLSQLRERMDEVPKDQPVYLHCRSSQRSYNALLALQQSGWDNIYNIAGSMLGLSYYEYFKDQTTDRESILTEYNFN
ncbi:MAG TPA: FAD-dependent oxidoreductase [Clostridiaceae bacterium]|nr:FAD-dependent oxidoreductase [Clostridiaceae bacterium]